MILDYCYQPFLILIKDLQYFYIDSLNKNQKNCGLFNSRCYRFWDLDQVLENQSLVERVATSLSLILARVRCLFQNCMKSIKFQSFVSEIQKTEVTLLTLLFDKLLQMFKKVEQCCYNTAPTIAIYYEFHSSFL